MTLAAAAIDEPEYQYGFGNEFQTEAVKGALPKHQNNPLPYQLYAEQLSGTAFTKPRSSNLRSWLYRIRPSVSGYELSSSSRNTDHPYQVFHMNRKATNGHSTSSSCCWFGWFPTDKDAVLSIDPNPYRWKPITLPSEEGHARNFIEGTYTYMASGEITMKSGLAIHMYAFNTNMSTTNLSMYNSDGDFLLVPHQESLRIQTEFGLLHVHVGDICVIPRGVVFTVDILNSISSHSSSSECDADATTPLLARGYILEIFKGHFELPDLGPIGSNGLANPRDFQYPVAYYDDETSRGNQEAAVLKNKVTSFDVVNKFCNKLFVRSQCHSPFNVVAWHGNYAPFKYDLSKFCCINSVTFDHPDPSIYTVLTAKSDEVGTALADFVIFPPRWICMENTFRPPWFHRNCMAEFMGLIYGSYDAKSSGGFGPGCASLHNVMTPHGPDRETVEKEEMRLVGKGEGESNNVNVEIPVRFDGGLAFMFETSAILKLTPYAIETPTRDREYASCWNGIKGKFM